MTERQKQELSAQEKLIRREERSNDDGTINVEIHRWYEEDGEVTVEFITPTNDLETDTMEFPKAGGDLEEFKFYRLLQYCDLSVRNADMLEGEMVKASYEDFGDMWQIECEREESLSTKLQRNFEFISKISIFKLTLTLLHIFVLLLISISLLVLLL